MEYVLSPQSSNDLSELVYDIVTAFGAGPKWKENILATLRAQFCLKPIKYLTNEEKINN